jgi:hypothetical protein
MKVFLQLIIKKVVCIYGYRVWSIASILKENEKLFLG